MFEEVSKLIPDGPVKMKAGALLDESSPFGGSIMNRYTDAYPKARFIDGLGMLVKIAGYIAAGFVFLFFLTNGSNVPGGFGLGLFAAVIFPALIAFIFFVWGTLISAAGQFLLALLDQAVNTSPTINNAQQANIMGL